MNSFAVDAFEPETTLPAAASTEFAAVLSEQEWQELLADGLRADLADPRWGPGWKRPPVLLAY